MDEKNFSDSDKDYLRRSPIRTLIMPSRYKDYEFSILTDIADNSNAPVVDGHRVTVLNYIDSFKKGYHDAYIQALNHREEIAQAVRDFPAQIQIRFIERATRVYAKILQKLYHNSVFESEQSMNQNMQTLSELLHKGKGDSDENIISSEIKQIKRGDVPYFYTYADSLSLYGDGEELIKNRFAMSAADHILDNLYSMNDKDELFDLTYIDRAVRQYPAKLAKHEQSVNIRPERKGVTLSRDNALNEARKIFDEMYELRIPVPDNKFLWGYVNSGSFSLSFSDYTLYNGFTGMALFASALALVYHDRRVN